MHGGANSPSFERRLALSLMPGDEEQDAITSGDRALKPPVDRLPCAVEAVAVEV